MKLKFFAKKTILEMIVQVLFFFRETIVQELQVLLLLQYWFMDYFASSTFDTGEQSFREDIAVNWNSRAIYDCCPN